MAARFKSAISSIKRSNFGGLKDTIRSHIPNTNNDASYMSNEYIHASFFNDDNFLSIIKCLDGGYEISKDCIEYMENYLELLQEFIDSLYSYSKKWRTKINQQSSVSSYHTTKLAQRDTVSTPKRRAEILQKQYDAILKVITTYRTQVDRMYPNDRVGTTRKHHRTEAMKNLFKEASSALCKLSSKLEKLHEQEKKAKDTLHNANVQCENLSFEPTASKTKISAAKDNQSKRQDKLDEIQREIERTEEEYNQEYENYRSKAMNIYEKCRALEKERLDLLGETLIQFNNAAFSSEYSNEEHEIYEDLMLKLKVERDSLKDLDFWAKTYHVYDSTTSLSSEKSHNESISSQTTTRKTKESHKNETEDLTTKEETTPESVAEVEEEQSQADTITTTSTKTKSKKTKNNTKTESTTTNTTESIQV
ncbi:unnamed protein product [Rotaria sp. Silwood1]|nr:unnamed protein product [Rotaria sp. Silwood1]CAF3683352.1 unnamed protein product [Rotaria sp. Silwood1]CAF4921797.1 unnamed protein product [Rotaria sp. Silwood1]CAF4954902.1 unnamed protein product [Rotaria sp. Silwood1]